MKLAGAALVLLALLAVSVSGGGNSHGGSAKSCGTLHRYRHQFQYKLNKLKYRKPIIDAWTWWANNAPAGAKPVAFQINKDLGIGPLLYPSADNLVQPDLASRVDFPTEDALRAFWSWVYPNATYQKFVKNYIADGFRIQYFVASCPPPSGTYYRHTFEYQGADTLSNVQLQSIERVWHAAALASPYKPTSFAFGFDMGIGGELYPNNEPNYEFAGTLDFKKKSDLIGFWTWYKKSQYYATFQQLNDDYGLKIVRVQYLATL